MRTTIILSFFLAIILGQELCARENVNTTDSVEVVNDFKDLYRYQNFYLGRQPSLETLRWLKEQGVKQIINLRSEKENSQFSEWAFDEESIAKEMGFEYYSIPVNGAKDNTPEKLDEFISRISKNEKVLVHCAGGGRVTNFFMAYLVKSKEYAISEAVEIGKDLKFSLPLETLLDIKINMEVGER